MCVTVHFQVRKQKKGHLVEEGRKYIAFKFNEFYVKHPDQQLVTLFDMTDAGISNMVGQLLYTDEHHFAPYIHSYGNMTLLKAHIFSLAFNVIRTAFYIVMGLCSFFVIGK
jgi:hypothetical protein